MPVPLKYRAFISYCRADRASAQLLHSRLERYVLPRALRLVKPGLQHDKRPLRPIFRDEDELVPGADLPARIRSALEQSEFLIVICSPAAQSSQWVNREILEFQRLAGRERTLAVVVAGEPNAVSRGFAPDLECLPPALRQPEGVAEPLWVDWRATANPNTVPFLRLVAALLALNSLDDLIARDRAYRRRRLFTTWAAAAVIIAMVAGLAGLLALRWRAEAQRKSSTLTALARTAGESGNWERSARYGLLALKDAHAPALGFQAPEAEDVLRMVLLQHRRLGAARRLGVSKDDAWALSEGGEAVAIARQGVVKVFDAATGQPRSPVLATGKVDLLRFSPDGKLLITAFWPQPGDTTEIKLWSLATGLRILETAKLPAPFITDVALAPGNLNLLAVGQWADGGGLAMLFDMTSGAKRELKTFYSGIHSAVFSPDGAFVAVAWQEGVQLWRTATGQPAMEVLAIGGESARKVIALTPGNASLALGTSEGTLSLWEWQSRREMQSENVGVPIVDVKVSPDGRWLGAGLRDGTIRVRQRDELGFYSSRSLKFQPGGLFAFDPGQPRLVSLTGDGELRTSRIGSYARETRLTPTRVSALSGDGKTLVLVKDDGTLAAFATAGFAALGPAVSLPDPKNLSNSPFRLAVSRDGIWAAYQSPNATWLIHTRSGEHWKLADDAELYGDITFSPQGDRLAFNSDVKGTSQSDVQVWDVAARKPLHVFRIPHFVTALAFSPAGDRLLVGYHLAPALLYDLRRQTRIAHAIQGYGAALGFTPDGQSVTTLGLTSPMRHSSVQLWDAATGARRGPEVPFAPGQAGELLFAPSGRVLLAGEQGLVFWDSVTNFVMGPALEAGDRIRSVVFAPDESRVLALTQDWLLEWDTPFLASKGPALAREVCRVVLNGTMSKLSDEELKASPLLQPSQDADACR